MYAIGAGLVGTSTRNSAEDASHCISGVLSRLHQTPVLTALAGDVVGLTGQSIWTGIWAAFSAIVFAGTYYELRVIKEGVDIAQITAVFD